MTYQLAIHGGYNPDYYHFSNPSDLVDWLVSESAGRILEVSVHEV